MALNQEEKVELLRIARTTLESYLAAGARLATRRLPSIQPKGPHLQERGGAFVTLESHGNLRGCIGHMVADKPLYLSVQEMAIQAATGDPRFPAVTLEELSEIEIEISALSPLVVLPHDRLSEIRVGEHGLVISCGRSPAGGWQRGVLLPQVASREGWDRETFLSYTCRKAGLPLNAWKNPETVIETFTADVFSEKELGE